MASLFDPPALPGLWGDAVDVDTRMITDRMRRNQAYENSLFGRIGSLISSARDALPEAPEGLPPVGRNAARVGNFFADMLSEGAQTANRWLGAPQFPERVQQGDTLAPLGLAAMGAPFAVRGAIGSAGGRLGEGIRAYHASPHDFDRFSMSHIGTGEGSQAFGPGIYAAESPAVSGRGGFYDQKFTQQRGTPAHIYEVNIRANPEEMVDWERPLKEQPSLQAVIDEHFGPNAFVDTATGEDAIRLMQAALGNDRASEILREAGIPGIRYLDQGSRAAGEGTRNYVILRDDIIDIVKKYGMAAAVSTYGLEAVQQAMAEGDQ